MSCSLLFTTGHTAPVGPSQAAIAAPHATAPSYADADWPQIRVLYDALLRVWPSPAASWADAIALAGNDAERAFLSAQRAGSPRDPSSHPY